MCVTDRREAEKALKMFPDNLNLEVHFCDKKTEDRINVSSNEK